MSLLTSESEHLESLRRPRSPMPPSTTPPAQQLERHQHHHRRYQYRQSNNHTQSVDSSASSHLWYHNIKSVDSKHHEDSQHRLHHSKSVDHGKSSAKHINPIPRHSHSRSVDHSEEYNSVKQPKKDPISEKNEHERNTVDTSPMDQSTVRLKRQKLRREKTVEFENTTKDIGRESNHTPRPKTPFPDVPITQNSPACFNYLSNIFTPKKTNSEVSTTREDINDNLNRINNNSSAHKYSLSKVEKWINTIQANDEVNNLDYKRINDYSNSPIGIKLEYKEANNSIGNVVDSEKEANEAKVNEENDKRNDDTDLTHKSNDNKANGKSKDSVGKFDNNDSNKKSYANKKENEAIRARSPLPLQVTRHPIIPQLSITTDDTTPSLTMTSISATGNSFYQAVMKATSYLKVRLVRQNTNDRTLPEEAKTLDSGNVSCSHTDGKQLHSEEGEISGGLGNVSGSHTDGKQLVTEEGEISGSVGNVSGGHTDGKQLVTEEGEISGGVGNVSCSHTDGKQLHSEEGEISGGVGNVSCSHTDGKQLHSEEGEISGANSFHQAVMKAKSHLKVTFVRQNTNERTLLEKAKSLDSGNVSGSHTDGKQLNTEEGEISGGVGNVGGSHTDGKQLDTEEGEISGRVGNVSGSHTDGKQLNTEEREISGGVGNVGGSHTDGKQLDTEEGEISGGVGNVGGSHTDGKQLNTEEGEISGCVGNVGGSHTDGKQLNTEEGEISGGVGNVGGSHTDGKQLDTEEGEISGGVGNVSGSHTDGKQLNTEEGEISGGVGNVGGSHTDGKQLDTEEGEISGGVGNVSGSHTDGKQLNTGEGEISGGVGNVGGSHTDGKQLDTEEGEISGGVGNVSCSHTDGKQLNTEEGEISGVANNEGKAAADNDKRPPQGDKQEACDHHHVASGSCDHISQTGEATTEETHDIRYNSQVLNYDNDPLVTGGEGPVTNNQGNMIYVSDEATGEGGREMIKKSAHENLKSSVNINYCDGNEDENLCNDNRVLDTFSNREMCQDANIDVTAENVGKVNLSDKGELIYENHLKMANAYIGQIYSKDKRIKGPHSIGEGMGVNSNEQKEESPTDIYVNTGDKCNDTPGNSKYYRGDNIIGAQDKLTDKGNPDDASVRGDNRVVSDKRRYVDLNGGDNLDENSRENISDSGQKDVDVNRGEDRNNKQVENNKQANKGSQMNEKSDAKASNQTNEAANYQMGQNKNNIFVKNGPLSNDGYRNDCQHQNNEDSDGKQDEAQNSDDKNKKSATLSSLDSGEEHNNESQNEECDVLKVSHESVSNSAHKTLDLANLEDMMSCAVKEMSDSDHVSEYSDDFNDAESHTSGVLSPIIEKNLGNKKTKAKPLLNTKERGTKPNMTNETTDKSSSKKDDIKSKVKSYNSVRDNKKLKEKPGALKPLVVKQKAQIKIRDSDKSKGCTSPDTNTKPLKNRSKQTYQKSPRITNIYNPIKKPTSHIPALERRPLGVPVQLKSEALWHDNVLRVLLRGPLEKLPSLNDQKNSDNKTLPVNVELTFIPQVISRPVSPKRALNPFPHKPSVVKKNTLSVTSNKMLVSDRDILHMRATGEGFATKITKDSKNPLLPPINTKSQLSDISMYSQHGACVSKLSSTSKHTVTRPRGQSKPKK